MTPLGEALYCAVLHAVLIRGEGGRRIAAGVAELGRPLGEADKKQLRRLIHGKIHWGACREVSAWRQCAKALK